MKYKFVGGDERRKRTPHKKVKHTEGAEFEFVSGNGEVFKFVGSSSISASKRGAFKKLRKDLGTCLVDTVQEWEKEPVDLNEAKEIVLACIEQAESEGGKPKEWNRMRAIVSQIEELEELVRYIYNYMLRASGLSVSRVVGKGN